LTTITAEVINGRPDLVKLIKDWPIKQALGLGGSINRIAPTILLFYATHDCGF